MLSYKNNRFYIGGISFELPNNIYIVTEFERVTANGFAYTDSEGKITVTVGTDSSEESLEEYINSKDFAQNGFKVLQIMQGGYSGLKGTAALYSGGEREYGEVRLRLPQPTEGAKMFIIFVEVEKKDIPIKDAVKHPIITELIARLKSDIPQPH